MMVLVVETEMPMTGEIGKSWSLFSCVVISVCCGQFCVSFCMSCSPPLLEPHLTTSELWLGQEQEGILSELLSSSGFV